MKPNPIAANVLGTMGTLCWTGQLIPQVWKNYRNKKTTGLSPWLMLLWGISSAFLGVYAILQDLDIPLQVQPQLFGFLTILSWGQCMYYDSGKPKKISVLITVAVMAVIGCMEVLIIFVSRPAYERGISAPVQLCGILSFVLIAVGLLPQYWEIYVHKEVIGVSYTFILIDMVGGVLNDLSLAFAPEFDGLAAGTYTVVTVMDSFIIIAAIILNPRARKRRRLAAADATSAAGNMSVPAIGDRDIEGGRSGGVDTPDWRLETKEKEEGGIGGDGVRPRDMSTREDNSVPSSAFVSSTVVGSASLEDVGGCGGPAAGKEKESAGGVTPPTPSSLMPVAWSEGSEESGGIEEVVEMGMERRSAGK